jgi:sensor domain CHASE-containing protein
MEITLTAQSIITAGSVLAATIALIAFFAKIVRWVDKQGEQDERIKELETKHDDDMKSVKEELNLLVYGNLACLKGLQERGCNGPVTETIDTIEAYLNKKAHQ